jgi:hypothetical protein
MRVVIRVGTLLSDIFEQCIRWVTAVEHFLSLWLDLFVRWHALQFLKFFNCMHCRGVVWSFDH